MHADASEADLLKLSTNDFIGVVLKGPVACNSNFGFVVTYKSNGYDANLQISLNGPSVATGLDKMAADTELYTQCQRDLSAKKTPIIRSVAQPTRRSCTKAMECTKTRMNK